MPCVCASRSTRGVVLPSVPAISIFHPSIPTGNTRAPCRKRRVGHLQNHDRDTRWRYSDLFTRAENAVEGKKADVLQGAERHRHGVIDVPTNGNGTMETSKDKNRAANLLSRSKCRTKF